MVPPQVQPRARADLDQRERPPVGDRREGGQQAAAARDLVRLRAPGGERGREPLGAVGAERGERLAEAGPGPGAAGRGVVRRQRVAGIAQQLVVDRREEGHRRAIGRPARQREQIRPLGDQLAQLRVERRVGRRRRGRTSGSGARPRRGPWPGTLETCAAPPSSACSRSPAAAGATTSPPRRRPGVRTVAGGLDTPWAIAWLPDRRALVTERPGRVRLLSASGELRDEPVGEVDVVESDGSESGLLGIAVDPEFADNGFVYLYRTTGDGNEVARYRFAGDRLTEDGVVVEGIQAGPIHNGGRLAFGPDDRLYITTGEIGDASLAQADGLNGKVLRTADFRSDGVQPEVFTSGHRNVQGIDWEPGTDRLLITELGPDRDDEVNVLREGADYGWPDGGGESRWSTTRTSSRRPARRSCRAAARHGRATSCSPTSAASSCAGCPSTASAWRATRRCSRASTAACATSPRAPTATSTC